MTARSLRAARGVAATAIATLLAAVSHTLGGGTAPSAVLILAVTLCAAPLATALVGRRPRLWRLASAVLLSQIAFHLAFSVLGDVGAAGTAMSGHEHGSTGPALLPADGVVGGTAAVFSGDPLMIGAHLGAALVSIAVLHRGEHALRALIALVVDLVARRLSVPVSTDRPVLRAAASTPARPVRTPLTTSIRRRGPPFALLLP